MGAFMPCHTSFYPDFAGSKGDFHKKSSFFEKYQKTLDLPSLKKYATSKRLLSAL